MHINPAYLRIGALVLLMVFVYGSRMVRGTAKDTPAGVVFALKPLVLASRAAALLMYLGFLVYFIHAGGHQIPLWFPAVLLAAAGLLLTQLPGTITLSPTGITQDFWFLKRRVISWPEVMSLQSYAGGRAMRVAGDNRVNITHTGNHVDAPRFRTELERLSGKRLLQ